MTGRTLLVAIARLIEDESPLNELQAIDLAEKACALMLEPHVPVDVGVMLGAGTLIGALRSTGDDAMACQVGGHPGDTVRWITRCGEEWHLRVLTGALP